MINYVTSSQDVLAVRIRDGLSSDELDELIRRLQDKIGRNPKTQVWVDIDRFRAEDWKSAFEALPRSWGLFRLDRYGRIAVVSDDKLVRTLSRVESAILPRIHYEIFHAEEADRALQWVEGKIDEPHEAALKFIETDNPLVLAYSIRNDKQSGPGTCDRHRTAPPRARAWTNSCVGTLWRRPFL